MEAGGDMVMTMEINESPELVKWILGWGDGVEVLSPDWLRDKIKSEILKMAAVYEH